MTVIHSTASAQPRIATLHLIVHELLAFFGGLLLFQTAAELGEVQNQWSSLEQTLEGHALCVGAVAFSPDGKTVHSVAERNLPRYQAKWDAEKHSFLTPIPGKRTLSNLHSLKKNFGIRHEVSFSQQQKLQYGHLKTGDALTAESCKCRTAYKDKYPCRISYLALYEQQRVLKRSLVLFEKLETQEQI